MESQVGLALAVKLKALFERADKPDRFLTFPLGMGLTYQELDFLKDDSMLSAEEIRMQQRWRNAFARIVNMIPEDGVTYSAGSYLWDEYRNVLERASTAETDLTPAEQESLTQAEEFLTDIVTQDAGGEVTVFSEAYKQYLAYQTRAYAAERAYLDEQETVMKSQDMELKQAWADSREQELLRAKQQADTEWQLLGFKDKIEACIQKKTTYGRRVPSLYMQRYKSDFDICQMPDDESGGIVYATSYSPRDIFNPAATWQAIHLYKNEMAAFVQNASPELKRHFLFGLDDTIESVALEYSEVYLAKDWFKPELFGSRYWNLTNSAEPISDGNLPRRGRIPAYISSMIVARNMVVTRRKPAGPSPIPVPHQVFRIRPELLMKPGQAVPPPPPMRPPVVRPGLPPGVIRRGAAGSEPVSAMRQPLGAHVMAGRPTAAMTVRPASVGVAPIKMKPAAFLPSKITGTTILNPTVVLPPPRPPRPPVQVETVTEKVSFNGVMVLAFVCKRLPKSPDPDPGLRWLA